MSNFIKGVPDDSNVYLREMSEAPDKSALSCISIVQSLSVILS